MTIGERIKEKRIEMGYTQDELANKCGYKSRSSINKIELSRSLPLTKVSLMAKALECSEAYLMGWEEEVVDVPEYDEDTMELIDLFSKITKEQKQTVLEMLRSFMK